MKLKALLFSAIALLFSSSTALAYNKLHNDWYSDEVTERYNGPNCKFDSTRDIDENALRSAVLLKNMAKSAEENEAYCLAAQLKYQLLTKLKPSNNVEIAASILELLSKGGFFREFNYLLEWYEKEYPRSKDLPRLKFKQITMYSKFFKNEHGIYIRGRHFCKAGFSNATLASKSPLALSTEIAILVRNYKQSHPNRFTNEIADIESYFINKNGAESTACYISRYILGEKSRFDNENIYTFWFDIYLRSIDFITSTSDSEYSEHDIQFHIAQSGFSLTNLNTICSSKDKKLCPNRDFSITAGEAKDRIKNKKLIEKLNKQQFKSRTDLKQEEKKRYNRAFQKYINRSKGRYCVRILSPNFDHHRGRLTFIAFNWRFCINNGHKSCTEWRHEKFDRNGPNAYDVAILCGIANTEHQHFFEVHHGTGFGKQSRSTVSKISYPEKFNQGEPNHHCFSYSNTHRFVTDLRYIELRSGNPENLKYTGDRCRYDETYNSLISKNFNGLSREESIEYLLLKETDYFKMTDAQVKRWNYLRKIVNSNMSLDARYIPRRDHIYEEQESENLEKTGTPRSKTKSKKKSFWDHNGSFMELKAEGNNRKFYYVTPRDALVKSGVQNGTLLFYGERRGNNMQGHAYVFSRLCGKKKYRVNGPISTSQTKVTMYGKAPLFAKDCSIRGYRDDKLVFTYQGSDMLF